MQYCVLLQCPLMIQRHQGVAVARRIKTHVGGVTQTSRPYATVPRSHKSPLEEGALISGRKLPISMATNHGRSMGECLTCAQHVCAYNEASLHFFRRNTRYSSTVHYSTLHCTTLHHTCRSTCACLVVVMTMAAPQQPYKWPSERFSGLPSCRC